MGLVNIAILYSEIRLGMHWNTVDSRYLDLAYLE